MNNLSHLSKFDVDKMIENHKRKVLVLSGARANKSVLSDVKAKDRKIELESKLS